jgi:hypothetical protein
MIVIPMANNSPQIPQENLLFWMDFNVPNCLPSGSINAGTINRTLNTGNLANGAVYQPVSASVLFPAASGNSIINTNFTTALGNFHAISIFRCLSTTATGNYQRVLDKSFANGFYIGRNSTTANQWGGGVRESGAPFGIFSTFTDNEWQMIGLSRTGTSIKLWNKGTVVNSKTGVSTATDTTGLRIGRDPAVAYGLGGYETAVFIYGRELTPAEMTQIYQYYSPRFNF